MSDKKHWITKLVPALAFAAGIIIASVGGIMTISSSLKLAMFETGPYSYISEDSCRYDYEKPYVDNAPVERSPEETKACIQERKQEEMERFQKSQKENIIDGVSALIVGGVLLLAFRRRK
ncbi:MAG: hypothetical protein MRY57_00775 [Candidatus Pacebacteria bacterium]|nr:hypothetical protein [Candidatus Paceibacterota bacterium]